MGISGAFWKIIKGDSMIDINWGWAVFGVVIVTMMILDLGVFQKKAHEIKVREALLMSGVWIGLALLFNLGVWAFRGHDTAVKFFTGYLLEESLSIDNLFVFLLVFSYFQVPG